MQTWSWPRQAFGQPISPFPGDPGIFEKDFPSTIQPMTIGGVSWPLLLGFGLLLLLLWSRR